MKPRMPLFLPERLLPARELRTRVLRSRHLQRRRRGSGSLRRRRPPHPHRAKRPPRLSSPRHAQSLPCLRKTRARSRPAGGCAQSLVIDVISHWKDRFLHGPNDALTSARITRVKLGHGRANRPGEPGQVGRDRCGRFEQGTVLPSGSHHLCSGSAGTPRPTSGGHDLN